MKFRVLRLVTLHVGIPQDKMPSWTVGSEGVDLQILRTWDRDGKTCALVASVADLTSALVVNDSNSVVIPPEFTSEAEAAIEAYANLLSVGEMCSCSISSPSPCVALIPQDDEAHAFLLDKNGIAQASHAECRFRHSTPVDTLTELLADRLDGTALLAEALSHKHPTGQLHEYMRVFEIAFGAAGAALVKPLSTFLEGNGQGYSFDEVGHWINVLRNQSTHADLRRQAKFVLAADVRPVLARVHQAAYDVLFNKLDWRCESPDRRSLWRPEAYVGAGSPATLNLRQGATLSQEMQLIDGFGSYPMDLSAVITPVPANWWSALPERTEPV